MACWILVLWSGIEPAPTALSAWDLNHWPTREVPHGQSCQENHNSWVSAAGTGFPFLRPGLDGCTNVALRLLPLGCDLHAITMHWLKFLRSSLFKLRVSQAVLVVKNLSAKAGDTRDPGSVPGSGRSPGGGKWQPTPVFLLGTSHGLEEPGGLESTGSQRAEHKWAQYSLFKLTPKPENLRKWNLRPPQTAS